MERGPNPAESLPGRRKIPEPMMPLIPTQSTSKKRSDRFIWLPIGRKSCNVWKMLTVVQQFKHYFAETIWQAEWSRLRWYQQFWIYLCRVVSIILKGISEHLLPVRATALAYTTL